MEEEAKAAAAEAEEQQKHEQAVSEHTQAVEQFLESPEGKQLETGAAARKKQWLQEWAQLKAAAAVADTKKRKLDVVNAKKEMLAGREMKKARQQTEAARAIRDGAS